MNMETLHSLEAGKPENSEKAPASVQCEGCFAASLCSRRHGRETAQIPYSSDKATNAIFEALFS